MNAYDATVIAVHDGDTLTANVEYPYAPHEWVVKQESIRLVGIQAAELKGVASDKANAAREFLAGQVLGKRIMLQKSGVDKYGGRSDAVVICNGMNVNDLMISSGHAVAWNGVGPKPLG